jgi:hypothetical protein
MSRATGKAGWRLGRPGLALMLTALVALTGTGAAAGQTTGDGQVVGRVGAITVTASSLHPGPSGSLTGSLRLITTAAASDQLDAALAAGRGAVGVYHQQVSVGEISDLAGCDGSLPPRLTVADWLHYGPLLVPGRAYGPSPPASGTLMVGTPSVSPASRLAITFYFARAGQLTLDVPVGRA